LVARCFSIGNFSREALTADAITVSGDGTPLFSNLHQSGLARLMRDVLATEKPAHILCKPDARASRNRYMPDIHKAQ
jgi:hypothetical protein